MRQYVRVSSVAPLATDSKADSMSAAVVPGAKLLAWMKKGPDEMPRMEMPLALFEGTIFVCASAASRAASMRLERAFRAAAEAGRGGALFGLIELVDAERYARSVLFQVWKVGSFEGIPYQLLQV